MALASLAACSAGDASLPPEPTVPTAPSSTTSTTVVDVSTIPEMIDEAYLNRVLAALDAVEAKATELIVTNKALVPEAAAMLNSIYSDDELTRQADAWVTALVDHPDRIDLGPSGFTRTTAVERVIAASPACVWVAVSRVYPATPFEAAFTRTEYVALQPLDPSNDPARSNPTAWMIMTAGFRGDGAEPANPCPS